MLTVSLNVMKGQKTGNISLPADVLWGLFVTHSFLGEKWMRDKQTPKDVCGEAMEIYVVVNFLS